MAAKSTHIFKTIGPVDLKVDIYTRASDAAGRLDLSPTSPVVLFIHGGGFVAFDREHLGPSIVQSCLKRGWPLVSTDYRKLPQVSGKELLEDVKDAYTFVRRKLPSILARSSEKLEPFENVIVVGQSAGEFSMLIRGRFLTDEGGYLALLCGHFQEHRPVAILSYYGVTTTSDEMFKINYQSTARPKILREAVAHYLDEPVSVGNTPPESAFHPEMLLPDLTRNPDFTMPAGDGTHPAHARQMLLPWFAQEKLFTAFMEDVDRSLDDPAWGSYVPTILVHGEVDAAVPLQASVNLAKVIGEFVVC